jgi:hypothetical protein
MKNNLKMFCLSLNPDHYKLIKELKYEPVILGKDNLSTEWFNDKSGENISFKNEYYGEYTFHYWIWKNYLDKIDTEWVGFCQYRKFFLKKKINLDNQENISFHLLKDSSLNFLDEKYSDFDCILGEQFSVTNYKLIKIFKKYPLEFIFKPLRFISNKTRTIQLHFDLYHGFGNLEKAIEFLDDDNKEDFKKYVNQKTSFHPHNMFVCKKKFLKKYYDTVFRWLKKCEKIFGFENLSGYGMKRIYGFLAERYMSYWFSKNCRIKELPILVKDLSDYKNF